MREFNPRASHLLLRVAPAPRPPAPFLVPTYGFAKRSRFVMAAALAINDLVAHDRNARPRRGRHLGPSRAISRDETLKLFPGLDPRRVTGGATWHTAMYTPIASCSRSCNRPLGRRCRRQPRRRHRFPADRSHGCRRDGSRRDRPRRSADQGTRHGERCGARGPRSWPARSPRSRRRPSPPACRGPSTS